LTKIKGTLQVSTHICFQSWLDHLRCLLPITGVLHIGATHARSVNSTNWGLTDIVFLEADETLQENLDLVSQDPGLPSPSSAPGYLLPRYINWAVIDCLPALPAIREAGKHLGQWEVVIARVALPNAKSTVEGAAKLELDNFFASSGYLCVSSQQDEENPEIGHALYVRHWQSTNLILLDELEKQISQHSSEHAAEVSGLQDCLSRQTALAAEGSLQMEYLTRLNEEQAKQVNHLQTELLQSTEKQRDLGKLTADLQEQINNLSREVANQNALSAERQVEIEACAKARDEQDRRRSYLRREMNKPASLPIARCR